MSAFELTFPGFVEATAELHRSLLPLSLVLLTIGFIIEFWHGMPTPFELMKTLVKMFLVILLVSRSHDLINEGQIYVKTWMEKSIRARPENVAERFKEKLVEAQNTKETEGEGFLGRILGTRDLFLAFIGALLTLIAWLAMAVMAFVYSVQRALLLACWSISPLLFPLMAIRPLSGLGLRHLLRILGIMLWPVGLGLAATFSEGLIEVIATGTSFAEVSTTEALGRGLTSLLGVVVLAIWILFSTFTAPLLIQRLLVGSDGPGLALARTGDMLSHAIPTTSAISGFARSTVHQGQSAYAVMARMLRSGNDSAGSTGTASVNRILAPSPTSSDSAPNFQTSPTDPTGDHAARAIVEKLKGK
jgi:hypothetical protein